MYCSFWEECKQSFAWLALILPSKNCCKLYFMGVSTFEAYIIKFVSFKLLWLFIPNLVDISVWVKLKKPACFTFLIISGKIKIRIYKYFILLLWLIMLFFKNLISTKELYLSIYKSGFWICPFWSEFRSRLEAHPAIYQLIIELINHSIQCLGSV